MGKEAVEGMVDEHVKFALDCAVATLPHNANLELWKKRTDDACTLCGERQITSSTPYTVAYEDRRFNGRHDSLLREIATIIKTYLYHLLHA